MNNCKTLREVCDELGISRRTVQGYEKKQLISPSSRNKYGYLLYDEETVRRIAFIRFSQQIGLSIKEISSFIDQPVEKIKIVLARQAEVLQRRKSAISDVISHIERISNLHERSELLDEVYSVVSSDRVTA